MYAGTLWGKQFLFPKCLIFPSKLWVQIDRLDQTQGLSTAVLSWMPPPDALDECMRILQQAVIG